jgi:RHS repeat-associated protein
MNILDEFTLSVLKALNSAKVEYLIVGGYAVNSHGYKRTTGDIDIWLRPSNENKVKVLAAFRALNIDEDILIELNKRTSGHANYYVAEVVSAQDYYAFGSTLVERTYTWPATAGSYRYGFNGKEYDQEWNSGGAEYDYGFRIYDPRLARFLSVDPLTKDYPWYTPYQFAGNKPINSIDIDGLEEYNVIMWQSSSGAYRTRIHLVKKDGPLIVNYYIRQQANTQSNPANPKCPDCLPKGVQGSDEPVVTKKVGKNGVTAGDIWESTAMADHAAELLHMTFDGDGVAYTEPSTASSPREVIFDGVISYSKIDMKHFKSMGQFVKTDESGATNMTPLTNAEVDNWISSNGTYIFKSTKKNA